MENTNITTTLVHYKIKYVISIYINNKIITIRNLKTITLVYYVILLTFLIIFMLKYIKTIQAFFGVVRSRPAICSKGFSIQTTSMSVLYIYLYLYCSNIY